MPDAVSRMGISPRSTTTSKGILDDGTTLVSDSTLRFRSKYEIVQSLTASGFEVDEVRDAPDRPDREMVFIARKASRIHDRPIRANQPDRSGRSPSVTNG